VYGDAVAGRRVSGRVQAASVPKDATTRPWPLRRTDIDVVGHVTTRPFGGRDRGCRRSVHSVALTHHGPVENGHAVSLATKPGRMWLVVGEKVRVSAEFSPN